MEFTTLTHSVIFAIVTEIAYTVRREAYCTEYRQGAFHAAALF